MGGCKDCLFFVNPYYPIMECIENDRFVYKLKEEKTECKRFVKATKENANEWLKSHKERRKNEKNRRNTFSKDNAQNREKANIL